MTPVEKLLQHLLIKQVFNSGEGKRAGMGPFIVIGTFVVGIGAAIWNHRRYPELRQAQRDWITWRDPFGLRAWKNHWRIMLQPVLAAAAWLVFWALALELIRGFGE